MSLSSPWETIIFIFIAVLIISSPTFWKFREKPKLLVRMFKGWILMFAGTLGIMLLLYLGFTYLPLFIPVFAIIAILVAGGLSIMILPFLKGK